MTNTIDYSRLREQTLASGAREEAVTVNTRALIDKVLARYSGDWTTFRELIQNASDAAASTVIIRYQTLPSSTKPVPQAPDTSTQLRHVLLNHTVKGVLVSNDGQPFDANDWARLNKIAEGNPDEQKIGAFGVGFYSVFADCDEPFVTSGGQAMAFYWRDNALLTKKGSVPEAQGSGDTFFMLENRDPKSPIPNLLSLAQFLATSLTFVGLQRIELWLDDWQLMNLKRTTAPHSNVALPRDIKTQTQDGLMKIVGVDHRHSQIDATWMNAVGWTPVSTEPKNLSTPGEQVGTSTQGIRTFLSRLAGSSGKAAARAAKAEEAVQKVILEDLCGTSSATVFLRVSTVNIQSYVSSSLAKELERATKKPPPKSTKIAILTSSYDETAASLSTISGASSHKAEEIFSSVLPTKAGRVFIGFPTAQTTGLLAHISAPSVIPTVERESIDLNARHVRTWNIEMLRVAGIACRIAYAGDMADLRRKSEENRNMHSSPASASQQLSQPDKFIPHAVHIAQQYTFQGSTPSSQVGQIIEEAFWASGGSSIEIMSSRGVLQSTKVRVASETLSFVEGIPQVPKEIMLGANEFVSKLQDFALLTEITISDISDQLQKQALNETQLVELLKWASGKLTSKQLEPAVVQSLLKATIATVDEAHKGSRPSTVLPLHQINTYLNVSRIAPDLPVPPHTIPFTFTSGMKQFELDSFGWEELQIIPWIRWLVESRVPSCLPEEEDVTRSAAFAAKVLAVLSKAYDSLSQSSKSALVELLGPRTVIPTKLGMRKPAEAYVSGVKLFDDLPTVSGLHAVKEKFLVALGVRKTIELSVIFDRLMERSTHSEKAEQPKWSHVELIRYLTSVKDDIPQQDIQRLRERPFCKAEQGGNATQSSSLYRLPDLFEPNDHSWSLGLLVLQWPPGFRSASPEGRFMSLLGLKAYPSVPDLIDVMVKAAASGEFPRYEVALAYFIHNHYANGYVKFKTAEVTEPFLPLRDREYILVPPSDCYTNTEAACLGYRILRPDLHAHAAKFGVLADPPMTDCAKRLMQRPPRGFAEARSVFGYLATRIGDVSNDLANQLGSASIVPVIKRTDTTTRYISPRNCFLGYNAEGFDAIFDFVDFGSKANGFLLRCGAKVEPTTLELAHITVRQPSMLFETLKLDKYLDLLRRFSASRSTLLKADKSFTAEMKRSAFLVAYRDVPAERSADLPLENGHSPYVFEEDGEQAGVRQYGLYKASSIMIVDDFISYTQFKGKFIAAPQEEHLENFYFALGARPLSTMVEEDVRIGFLRPDQSLAEKVQRRIVERSSLFLYDTPAADVLHDSRWLEKNLKAEVVGSISLTRTLRGHNATTTEKRTAAVTQRENREWVLSITPKPDLYEVSQGLISLLLKRPRPHSAALLDVLLSTDLKKLQARGYNVDRILRRQAAEERVVELQRQQRVEDERVQAETDEPKVQTPKKETNGENPGKRTPVKNHVPGSFDPYSPEQSNAPEAHQIGNFFANIGRQLGFNTNATGTANGRAPSPPPRPIEASPTDDIATAEPNHGDPPPYSATDPRTPRGPSHHTPLSPATLAQNLRSAIQASRSHNSPHLFSPPSANAIQELSSYCDSRPAQDISFYYNTLPGIKVFVSNTMINRSLTQSELAELAPTRMEAFASLLIDIASVFNLKIQSLHIFYDTSDLGGATIAFNSNGSIFCNFRYFSELHLQRPTSHVTEGWRNPLSLVKDKTEAAVYWWTVLCHELAHNLVADHSSEHSFYTEGFVQTYFGRMANKLWHLTGRLPPV